MTKENVVDFIIIGAMKAGSTTLTDYLRQNDNICMSEPKEPQFFSRNLSTMTIEEYESLWEYPNKICGEASTCYSRWPKYTDIPSQIYQYNPNMKLVYILRDPIERAYSHYRHNVLTDKLSYKSFQDALDKSEEIISSSMYMMQIERYLEYFPREQILLVDFDDLIHNNIHVINEIERFLGVKVSLSEEINDTYANKVGIGAASRTLRDLLDKVRNLKVVNFLVNKAFKPDTRKKIRKKLDSWLLNSSLLKYIANKKISKLDSLSENHISLLSNELLNDIELLEKWWNKDLQKWKYYKE